jgi:hypothetical protein
LAVPVFLIIVAVRLLVISFILRFLSAVTPFVITFMEVAGALKLLALCMFLILQLWLLILVLYNQ